MNNYLLCVFSPLIVGALQLALTRRPAYTMIGHQSEVQKRRYLIATCFVLFLFVAVRAPSVGSGDGRFYTRNWEAAGRIPFSRISVLFKVDLEKGYLLTVWLLSHVFHDGQWVFVFQGAIMMYAVGRFLEQNCDSPLIGLLAFTSLGLFNFMVQAVRQSIAISICMLSISLIKKRKLLPFLLTIALAGTFHGSAVAFLPIYFFFGRRFRFLDILRFSAFAALGLLLLPYLFDLMNLAISDSYTVNQGTGFDSGSVTILINLSILLVCMIFRDKTEQGADSAEKEFYLFMMLAFFIVFMLRYVVSGIAIRVSYYYMISQAVLIPASLKRLEKNSQFFTVCAIVILMSLLILHKASYSTLSPYPFFWQT